MTRHRGLVRRAIYSALGVTLFAGLMVPPASAQEDMPWMDTSLPPEERATLLIQAMTEEEKIEQIAMELDNAGPTNDNENPPPDGNEDLPGCEWYDVGRHLEGMLEKGIPSIRMINGPSGVGGGDCRDDPSATGLPSGIGVAASFDRNLAYEWGDMAGAEVRANGHAVFLAPGVNLGRVAQAGRNFEYFGEDPYLSGVMGVEQILAIQSNDVHANVKHYAFNEQETNRRSMNTIIPPRAAHELYLLPFEMAAKDGDVASMMCSFPRIYGVYACENPELLTDVARERWDWHGYILSDRRATLSTIDSIDAGFDLEFPRRVYFSEERIRGALAGDLGPTDDGENELPAEEGEITWEQIETMLHRRFTQMFKFGLVDNPVTGFMEEDAKEDLLADHNDRALAMAEDSMVLMKNDDGTLPLDAGALDSVAVIGARYFAEDAKFGPNSPNLDSTVNAPDEYIVGGVEGIENTLEDLGSDTEVVPYFIDAGEDSEDYTTAIEAADDHDAAIIMVGDLSVEGSDRSTLRLPGPDDVVDPDEEGYINFDQEQLIRDVAAVNPNTVVVLKNGGPVLTGWRDQVPAILEAWYPGQTDGDAVANVLFGVVNPSGKLPMTFPITEREAAFATESQFPGIPTDAFEPQPGDPEFGTETDEVLESTYSEDLEMGYRWYEAHNIAPAFAFGHGLSYTTFDYSDLNVMRLTGSSGEPALRVNFTVTNTGDVRGAEAPQVYLTLPDEADEPSKRLVQFDKVDLQPGASERVSLVIDSGASNHPFSYFVPEPNGTWADGEWATPDGPFTVHVGTSSADTALEEAGLTLTAPPELQPVTPAPVTFSDTNSTYTVPSTPGVEYVVGGQVVAAGTHTGSGMVTVMARALDGFVLAPGATAEWSHTFTAPTGQFGFFLNDAWDTTANHVFMYGRFADEVLIGDWDGDGTDSITVRRGNVFYVNNAPRGGEAEHVFVYGRPGDTVLVGDWDGDGVDTLAVRRGAEYHVKNNLAGGPADQVVVYGRSGDQVVVGDWDGDTLDTFAVRRGAQYFVKNTIAAGEADQVVVYGRAGDITLAGDWDGDGDDTFAVRRGATYYVKNTIAAGEADIVLVYGRAGDEVYVGDWNGDGEDTLGVRRAP